VAGLAPHDLYGDWVLTWASGKWELSLSPFGVYRCWAAGSDSEWVGTWHLDGAGRLVVEERSIGPQGAGPVWQWYVVWTRDRAGLMSRGRPAGEALWGDGRTAAAIALERKR
jgi:hypothetical protein